MQIPQLQPSFLDCGHVSYGLLWGAGPWNCQGRMKDFTTPRAQHRIIPTLNVFACPVTWVLVPQSGMEPSAESSACPEL